MIVQHAGRIVKHCEDQALEADIARIQAMTKVEAWTCVKPSYRKISFLTDIIHLPSLEEKQKTTVVHGT
jgi:hypothetical protein